LNYYYFTNAFTPEEIVKIIEIWDFNSTCVLPPYLESFCRYKYYAEKLGQFKLN
jgi:hypothetical protein